MTSEKNNDEQKKEQKKIYNETMKEIKKEAGIVRRIVFAIFLVILFAAIGTGYYLFQYVTNAIGPVDENNNTAIEINIPIGSSVDSIGAILEENQVIASADIFKYYIRFKSEDGFQAGDYRLTQAMNLDEIIQEIKQGRIYQEYKTNFTIPEGRWVDQVFEIIAKNTNLTEEELFEVMENEEFINELMDRFAIVDEVITGENIRWPLEGYLFPARYDFVEDELDAETLIRQMVERTSDVLNTNGASGADFTFHEILTMASIIEGEARNDEERIMISGVIHNRLNPSVNMPLQMDPTVAYAHGEHIPRTLNEHLELQSPYNTYYVRGLPVGPINNPGEASIQAALEPEEHDYLYFFHSPDGKVHFTKSLSEHNQIVNQYR